MSKGHKRIDGHETAFEAIGRDHAERFHLDFWTGGTVSMLPISEAMDQACSALAADLGLASYWRRKAKALAVAAFDRRFRELPPPPRG